MKNKLSALVLIVAMSLCSFAYAYDIKGPGDRTPRHKLLYQLSAESEILFHQTMRDAWKKTVNIREQLKELRAEIKDILTAPEFDEVLFLEKTKSIQNLRQLMKTTMDEAVVKLANQFTQEEREILIKLIPHKHSHRGK
jgi:uncharacterized membrane protein